MNQSASRLITKVLGVVPVKEQEHFIWAVCVILIGVLLIATGLDMRGII